VRTSVQVMHRLTQQNILTLNLILYKWKSDKSDWIPPLSSVSLTIVPILLRLDAQKP